MNKAIRQILLSAVIVVGLMHPSLADAIERVLDYHRDECLALMEEERNIDADLDQIISDPLIVSDNSIYQIQISNEGTSATVIFADFSCEGYGTPWCGSGGCRSMIIVEEQVYGPLLGGRPTSVSVPAAYGEDQIVTLISLGGSRCQDADGNSGINASPCFMSAIWDDYDRTFYSSGVPVVTWP